MSEQTLALVTGANQGIGYEIAAGLGALGWSVGIGDRDPERQQVAVAKLRADGVDAFPVPIDVTDDASVAAAARQIEKHADRLGVLVNNAGATGAWPQNPTTLNLDSARAAVETNVFGMIRVTNAMLPLLRRSAHPRIVNQSSHVGSLTLQTTPGVELGEISAAYAPTKTYLNAVTIQYVKEPGRRPYLSAVRRRRSRALVTAPAHSARTVSREEVSSADLHLHGHVHAADRYDDRAGRAA